MSWEKKTIGELCQIEKGKIGIQKATPGEFPLVVTAEERLSHNEYHFEGNAVVIPLVSSTGHGHRSLKRIHFQSGKFAVGNILCVVMPNDENILRADYLYRFLDLNREKELVGRMRGMANVTLPIKEIAKIEIPVPPIAAQIEFVQQYSNLEEKSNELGGELTHQLDLVKQLRQSFLREAMQGKLVPQDPNDEPASVLLEKIKADKERLIKEKKIKKQKPLPPITEEEIPFEIPESWLWCKLGELTNDLLGGFAFKSSKYIKESKNQVIRLGNVKNDNLLLGANPAFISDEYASIAAKAKLLKDDILVTMTGTRAKRDYLFTLLLNEEHFEEVNLYLNQRVGAFRLNELINREFINYLLKEPKILEPVFLSSTGAANQANIGVSALNNILVPLPPLNEQEHIVLKLDELMQYCDELEASIKESQQQNELLLQQVLREALEPSYAKASDGKPKPTVVSEGNQKEMEIEKI